MGRDARGAARNRLQNAGPATVLALIVLAGSSAVAQGEAASDWTHPRTSWGEPDLRGMWPIGHLTGTPLQRPPQFGEREYLTDEEFAERQARLEAAAARYDNEESANKLGMGHWAETGDPNRRTSLIVDPPDGRIPALTAEGQAIADAMRSSWHDIHWDWVTDFDSWDRCITRGMPASMFPFMYNNGVEIFQSPGYVVVNMEMVHEARIIPTDGRAAPGAALAQWLGDSRGRWDGDTLVVETTNFQAGPPTTNEKPGRHPIGPSTRIVERFTRTGPETLDYEMTFEDPVLYTAPWTVKMPWRLDPSYEMFEYACHEANYMVRDYINASRAGRAGGEGAEE
jgi:hypothetical protein